VSHVVFSGRMIVNGVLERIWKQSCPHLKVLSQHFSQGTRYNHKEIVGYATSEPNYKCRVTQIYKNANHLIVIFGWKAWITHNLQQTNSKFY
jgi:hypothetical protein